MPGAGKSTVGVLLAKAMSMHFIDTDISIQMAQGDQLQDIIDELGLDEFAKIEEQTLLSIAARNTVIATGGSAIYSDAAMAHLQEDAITIFLDVDLDRIEHRISNFSSRGVAIEPGENLATLYKKRKPLYEKFADITINSSDLTLEDTVTKTVEALKA